jgi:hypothetical protein
MAMTIPQAMIDAFREELLSLASARLDAMPDKLSVELLGETDPAVIEAKFDAEIKAIIEEIDQLKADFERCCLAAATDREGPTIN